jgi:hypothetical protein
MLQSEYNLRFTKISHFINAILFSHDSLLSDEMRTNVISICPKREEIQNIIQVPLLDFHVGLWASSDYLERYGRPKSLADLRRHRLIVFAKDLDKMPYKNLNWHLLSILWCQKRHWLLQVCS